MTRIASLLALVAALLPPTGALAQQARDFGDHVVHYNAFSADLLTPQIAQAYGITRSPSRAVLNVTVLKKETETPGTPVRAAVVARATNLVGQRREIPIREIREAGGAVYYLGEFGVRHMETWRFEVSIAVEGAQQPLVVRFSQQFYTE